MIVILDRDFIVRGIKEIGKNSENGRLKSLCRCFSRGDCRSKGSYPSRGVWGIDADSSLVVIEGVGGEPLFAGFASEEAGTSLVVITEDDAYHFDFVIAGVEVDKLVMTCTELEVDTPVVTTGSEVGTLLDGV